MNPLKRLYRYIKPYNKTFVQSICFTSFSLLARSANPFIIGLGLTQLASDVMAKRDINLRYMAIITIILLITGAIDAFGEYMADKRLAVVAQSTMYDLRLAISNKLNMLPVSYFDQNLQGEVLNKITNDIDTIGGAFQQGFLQVYNAAITLTLSFGFMVYLSPLFAVVALFLLPICFFLYRIFTRRSRPHFQALQDNLGRLNGYIKEHYSGFSVIKLFGQEKKSVAGFEEIIDDLYDSGFRANLIASAINPVLSAVTHVTYIGLLLVMIMTVLGKPIMLNGVVIAGAMAIGGIQSFVQYVWQASGPIGQVTQLSGIFQTAGASLNRVFNLLDENEEPADPIAADIDIADIRGDVTFKNVRFGYNKDKPLMEDVSFEVKSGEMVAIVGPTGAGKTTLINLLMRFYDIDSGEILIDGHNVNQLTRAQTRSVFGMVLQDPWLYHASIADNIRFGSLDANEYQVVDAAKAANVHRFIRTLPEGYSTMLDKEASNISQGQRQLLTIARVLVGDPKIIILDEATSSVDTRLELLIQKAMKKAMAGRTSVVIAHRLSTIRDADLILVMSQGAIVEQGTHESLVNQGGVYKELYESQFAQQEEE